MERPAQAQRRTCLRVIGGCAQTACRGRFIMYGLYRLAPSKDADRNRCELNGVDVAAYRNESSGR